MGEDVEEIIKTKWGELEEKVLTMAQQQNDNNQLQALLELSERKREYVIW